MKKTSAKYKMDQYVFFSYEIKAAIWNVSEGEWYITVQKEETVFPDVCDIFINAGGVLK